MPVPQDSATTLGGRYRLEAPIGRGGMATVFRAHDEALGRYVAVKLFDAGTVDTARQETELSVLASLDHHSIVTLLDAGLHTDDAGVAQRYLVMALVTGVDLHERIRSGPLAARHIAEIGYDLAEALEYIHLHNVIHRDIKPSNVLLVDYGNEAPRARAKLSDFGIALADDVERMTVEGQTTGTAAYLSPEQVAGLEVGKASDIYALGLVLLQCFTRTVEFPGAIVESAVARLSRDPEIPETLPAHWRALLAAMTARDPAERPVGRELVSTLRQVVIAESGRHRDEPAAVFPDDARPDETRSELLDTLPSEALHRVTALAARMFSAPVAVVSVVDGDRTWLESHYGAEVEQLVRQVDLSRATVPQEEPLVIEDARIDPRTKDSALVTGDLRMRFYAGVPLRRRDGKVIGTLSVVNFIPGTASEEEIANLQDLAALAVTQLEARGLLSGEKSGA